MKKTIAFIAVASLALNTTIGGVSVVTSTTKQSKSQNQTLSPAQAEKYANETSIIPKSLLIGKQQGFSTETLLTNLNSKLVGSDLQFNMPTENNGNAFIQNLTTDKLDVDTIGNIQCNFQSKGINQKVIDDANAKIAELNSYKSYANDAVDYVNNTTLSNSNISDFIDSFLHQAKSSYPDIIKYLSYAKYEKFITLATNELLNDWDQQAQYDSDPISAMQKYIATDKGDIAEAKQISNKPQWNYVLVQAKKHNWNWDNFYEYMAGANLNYMFKTLSDKSYFIGDLINNHLHLLPWNQGLDSGFLPEFQATIDKLASTPKAWPYLIKAIVPIVKAKILKMQAPTLGVKDLTWDNTLPGAINQSVELKLILQEVAHLLSPEGKPALINLVADLLTGPFGSDIILDMGIPGYFTLPEAFETFSWLSSDLDPKKLAGTIVDELTKNITALNIPEMINKVIKFTDSYLTKNPQIDLRDLASYLNNIFNSDFNQAIDEVVDIVENPSTSKYHASDILALLGVQQTGQKDFKANSTLYWIQKWLQEPNSTINQLLGVVSSKDGTGIIDNMIKKQQDFINQNYFSYFDIDNTSKYKITNITTSESTTTLTLSYILTDVQNNQKYNIVFLSQDKDHKNFLLHRFN